MTTLVRLEAEVVATVGATRFFLTPRIEALPEDDATRRMVELMCTYALDIEAGRLPGPYSDADAAFVARVSLERLG